jgi:Domain of unknown function (DUF222)
MTETPPPSEERDGEQPPEPPTPAGQVPGPALAQALRAAAGQDGARLAGLTDSELLEMIRGGRAMTSWTTWIELAAMAEYGARHPAGKGEPGLFRRGAADEVGFAVRMTWTGAGDRMAFGASLAQRLPETFAALRDGLIDPLHAKIIGDCTTVLSPEDAAAADKLLAPAAAGLTAGQLRARAARVVLRLDPDAARRHREACRREASVRAFREDSGNGGLTGRELPADELLASWQNIEQRALDLRALGVEGSLRELQVMAMLDLLQERDSSGRLTAQDNTAQDQDGQDSQDQDARDDAAQDDAAQDEGDDEPEDGEDEGGPQDGGGAGPAGPRGPAGNGGTRLAAQVTIIVPYQAWLGLASGPGEVTGFGLIDPAQIQDLLAAAARDQASRSCITLLGPDGTAVAHGCGRGPLTLPPQQTDGGKPDTPDPPGTGPPGTGPPGTGPPGTGPPGMAAKRRPDGPAAPASQVEDLIRRLKVRLALLAREPCDHRNAETGRLPSRKLRHLIRARNPTCTAPGCGRPAIGSEQDHTLAWEDGGITCECNLGPLCRHHHIVKHLGGWRLWQSKPGTFTWHTPAGRTYTTGPAGY